MSTSDFDDEHDAHLQAALRHAPDAALAAPPQLREAILHQARIAARAGSPLPSAAAPSPAVAQPGWWQSIDRLTRWLARPAVATGFASLAAATLIGLMWWDQPMDERVASSTAPARDGLRTPSTQAATGGEDNARVDGAVARPPAIDAVPAAAPVTPRGSSGFDGGDLKDTTRTTAGTAKRARAREAIPAPEIKSTVRRADGTVAPQEMPAVAADKATRAPDVGDERGGALRDATRPVATLAPQPPLARPAQESLRAEPSRQADASSPPPEPLGKAAAAPTLPSTAARLRAMTVPERTPEPTRPPAMAATPSRAPSSTSTAATRDDRAANAETETRRSSPTVVAALAASRASTPLAGIDAQISADAARWRWRRDGGAPLPIDDRVARWVRTFDGAALWTDANDMRSTSGAFAATPATPSPSARPQAFEDAGAAPIQIELLRDGRLRATLRIEADGTLTVLRPGTPIARSQAAQPADALDGLRTLAP